MTPTMTPRQSSQSSQPSTSTVKPIKSSRSIKSIHSSSSNSINPVGWFNSIQTNPIKAIEPISSSESIRSNTCFLLGRPSPQTPPTNPIYFTLEYRTALPSAPDGTLTFKFTFTYTLTFTLTFTSAFQCILNNRIE